MISNTSFFRIFIVEYKKAQIKAYERGEVL